MSVARKHFDGDEYFDPAVLNLVYRQGPMSRDTVVHMSPDEFLLMAKQLKQARTDKFSGTKELFKKGVKFNEIPYLVVETRPDGDVDVIGHEGRHRSLTLRMHGIKKIPVVIKSMPGKKDPSFRWGQTRLRPRKMYSQSKGVGIVRMPEVETY